MALIIDTAIGERASSNCLELLKFPTFQAKMRARLQQSDNSKTGGSGNADGLPLPKGTGPSHENVFKILMAKINSLETSQAILELYTTQITDCYRNILGEHDQKLGVAMSTTTSILSRLPPDSDDILDVDIHVQGQGEAGGPGLGSGSGSGSAAESESIIDINIIDEMNEIITGSDASDLVLALYVFASIAVVSLLSSLALFWYFVFRKEQEEDNVAMPINPVNAASALDIGDAVSTVYAPALARAIPPAPVIVPVPEKGLKEKQKGRKSSREREAGGRASRSRKTTK